MSLSEVVTRVAIHGAAGRMGRRLVALGHGDPRLSVVAAIEQSDSAELGADAGVLAGVGPIEVPIGDSLDCEADALIDFSLPTATAGLVEMCRNRGLPLVLATTGFGDEVQDEVQAAAETIPIVQAPNMSLAVNLAMQLVSQASRALRDVPGGADVEILERHHRFKEDSPSGTALRFGELVAAEMGQTQQRHGREGQVGARSHGEIGYHAIRVGDNPGEHTIVFSMLGETIEVSVKATNRDCYAQGALAAARWLHGKQPGLYSMYDVMGLNT